MRIPLLGLTLLYLLLPGCQSSDFFNETVEIAPFGWVISEEPTFSFDVIDTTARYNLSLFIQHRDQYEYQNLYLRLTTIFPNRAPLEKIISVDLADAQGRWYGRCRGSNCVTEISLQENAFFEASGRHEVKVSQHMRVDTVPHVSALTLRLQNIGS